LPYKYTRNTKANLHDSLKRQYETHEDGNHKNKPELMDEIKIKGIEK
jgi:hypothetical protein